MRLISFVFAACVGVTALLSPLGTANALSCSQANSECDAKLLANPVTAPPLVAQGNAKVILNFICLNCSFVALPSNGVVPTSPLTHFR